MVLRSETRVLSPNSTVEVGTLAQDARHGPLPLLLIVLGWHQFWCRTMDAAYTKLIGAGLLFACVSAFLSLAFETLDGASIEERTDPGLIKEKIRVDLQRFFRKRSGLRPLVVPVVMEI